MRIIDDMKRPFTLIEVLIGFALASLVLGMLFSSLYETSLVSSRLEKAEKVILGRAEFQQRLDAVFGNLIHYKQGEKPSFFLSQKDKTPDTLYLQFRCGIDPDPCFSDQVEGVLKLNNQDLLFQVNGNTLPGKTAPEPRVAILKRSVTKMEYEFLSNGKVSTIWEEKETMSPDFLKLTLFFGENKKEDYVFWMNKEPEGILIK